MLTDSTSPQNALECLCKWLALPETKEVLNHLKDKAEATDSLIKRRPDAFRDPKNDTILSGDVIVMIKERATGEQIGLKYLSTLLAQREVDLREKLAKSNETKT
jgi:hypothetical protein